VDYFSKFLSTQHVYSVQMSVLSLVAYEQTLRISYVVS
jgi:hypothetical protein